MNLSLNRSDVCRLMRACTILDHALDDEEGCSQWRRLHDELEKQMEAFDFRMKQKKEVK